MKRVIILLTFVLALYSETLFEVKDSSDNKVLDVSTDGLRILNQGDTLMVISASEIKANLESSKGLSRSFSVTTTQSKGSADIMRLTSDSTRFWISDTGSGFGVATQNMSSKGIQTNVLEVSTSDTKMREGAQGDEYTDFSPLNIFLGLHAGQSTTGSNNVFIGNESGNSNLGGSSNTFSGYNSGFKNNSGSNNVFMGRGAGYSNESGGSNVFIGYDAGYSNVVNGTNTYVGNSAGYFSTGSLNAFYGFASGYSNVGNNNSFFGQNSGSMNANGSDNCLFGYSAGVQCNGSQNTLFGTKAGYENESGSGNVFVGYQSGFNETGSNRLYIDNSNTSSPLIYGEFDNNNLIFNTSKLYVKHPSGTQYGLYIQNANYTNYWNMYQYSTGGLYLFYNGTQRGSWDITSGVYTAVSDRKLKKNITDLEDVSERVMKLQPKRYNFNDQENNGRKFIGLIAQDVLDLFPEFVYFNEENQTYSMDYAGLSVVAIKALKEMNKKIDDLESENKNLRKEIDKINERLEELNN